jgi:hypothetical protein
VLKPGGIPVWPSSGANTCWPHQASQLTGVFTSDIGGLNQWMHIWAYKSLARAHNVRKRQPWTASGPRLCDSDLNRRRILLAAGSRRSSGR